MTKPSLHNFSAKLDQMILVYSKAGQVAEEQTKTLRQCRAAIDSTQAINQRLMFEAQLTRDDAKTLAEAMRADEHERGYNDPLWQEVIAFLESF